MKLPRKKGDTFTQINFKKGIITCPICGKAHQYHCSVTEDGGLAICKYVSSNKQAKDGRYEHIIKSDFNNAQSATPQINKPESITVEKANADELNKVYSGFLKCLKLSNAHANQLRDNRGLPDEAIARNLYATVPSRNKSFEVGIALSKKVDLKGIPGFYTKDGVWCLNINYSGFYVPYRDVQGRIVGLQIRKDKDEKPKYLWLTSNDRENGCSSGLPLHFVNSEIVKETNEVFITEGALKADIIGELYNVGVVAVAGVNAAAPEDLTNSLFDAFPDVERIVLAFDMDWETNKDVREALLKIIRELKQRFVSVRVMTWDRKFGKGLDDVLVKTELADLEKEDFFNFVKAEEFLSRIMNEIEDEIISGLESQNLDDLLLSDKQENSTVSNEEISYKEKNTLGFTWKEFSKAKFEKPERVIFGLCRGNVGQLVASTNVGKTTLMLNLAISASANKGFEPLLNEQTVGKRILYIDGEATKAELQSDLFKMLETCSQSERESVKANLYLICDEEINDEPLDLVNPLHREKILTEALLFKPDLIVVDTLSALTTMEDENDNAKVKNEVIQPLKTLAKRTNSAVLLLHHTGKYNEGSPQAVDAYKGRGASALGALSRTVFNLKESKDKVVLSCSKVKGEKFEEITLKLDQSSRWFKIINDISVKPATNYEQVINFVRNAGKPVKRDEIMNSLKMKGSTLTRDLGDAVVNGDLIKPEYGYYSVPESMNPEQELPLED